MTTADHATRRPMTLCVPCALTRWSGNATVSPVSLGIIDQGLLNFRRKNTAWRALVLALNEVAADALADCIVLWHRLCTPLPQLQQEPEG